jgi:sugar phosphate isomerase/epimerase
MRLGLAGDLIPRDPAALTPEVARSLAALGIRVLVTHFQAPPEALAGDLGRRVRAVLAEAGLSIVQATGYNPNLVHPDPLVRERDLARLHAAFAAARTLGAEMVISGCGSLHPTFFYGPAAANHRPETRDRLIESLRRAALLAEDTGVPLALECHVLTTLDTPAHILSILEAVGSPWVRANVDPVNLIGDLPALYDNATAIRQAAALLLPHYVPCAHIKDIAAQPELVLHLAEAPPGTGLLDYTAVFEVCRQLGENTALVVEHLPAAQVPAALAFIRQIAPLHGIELG